MKKNYEEYNKHLKAIVEEQKEKIDMLTDLLKEEVHDILNCGLANNAIMGFCTMAMVQAGLSKEDTRKVWNTLEDVLEEYESEDAEDIYELFMGRNEPLMHHIEDSIGKSVQV